MLVKEGFRIPHIDELCKETSEIGSILWLILSCLDDARRRWWCNLIFFTSEDKPTIPDDILFGRRTTLCIFNLSIWVSIFRRVMLRAGNSEFCQTAFCFFVKLAHARLFLFRHDYCCKYEAGVFAPKTHALCKLWSFPLKRAFRFLRCIF